MKSIPGDTWRKRHDSVKQDIVSKAAHAGVQVDWEVYGVFSDLLPAAAQEEGGEFQWGRARQGQVPGFRFTLPTQNGPVSIGCGKTWFPSGAAIKGRGLYSSLLASQSDALIVAPHSDPTQPIHPIPLKAQKHVCPIYYDR